MTTTAPQDPTPPRDTLIIGSRGHLRYQHEKLRTAAQAVVDAYEQYAKSTTCTLEAIKLNDAIHALRRELEGK